MALVVAGSVLAGVGATPAGAGSRRELLQTKVHWVDTSQNSGTMLFQGEIIDGDLTGRAYPGNGVELIVTGTVASDGSVAGTLDTTESELVGTFTGSLNGEDELEGDLLIGGEVDSTWVAPADEVAAEVAEN
jgi:hypothetical protein